MLIISFVDKKNLEPGAQFPPMQTLTGSDESIKYFYYSFLYQNPRFTKVRVWEITNNMEELQVPITDNLAPKHSEFNLRKDPAK